MQSSRQPPSFPEAPRITGEVATGEPVSILIDGREASARAGESVASAMLALGVRAFRRSAVRGEPRGPFCMMGICQECLVEVDGRRAQACMVPVQAGMRIGTLLA